MQKHSSVRLKRFHDGEIALSRNGRVVKGSRIEVRDPALRNINDELFHLGFEYEVDGCKLFWFQFDSDFEPEHYIAMNEVEIAFSSDWFEEQKRKIRYLSGINYVEACTEIAKSFTVKPQNRIIEYTLDAKCV